ncbi:MAG: ADP-forming succinate--CoA ligase subunit beta [Propylenella sp.]
MNLHEFQAKEILARRGVPVPPGQVAWTAEEAGQVAKELGGARFAVKAQILAGGRGEAGGVKIAYSPDEVRDAAGAMLGSKLVTAQTRAAGRSVRRVYVEQGISVAREIYVGVTVDRDQGEIVLLGTGQGGGKVEEQVRVDPASLQRLAFDGTATPSAEALREFAGALGLQGAHADEAAKMSEALARAFVELDASLIEVNPLAVSKEGRLLALDVKMTVDDNALFRQPELLILRDDGEVDEQELEAQRHDLNFVRMDGNIGVVVNGAGLALATHDILCDCGGAPANFMDIRTSAMSLQIAKGIGLLLADPRVAVIFVNVHGGGMTSCDTIVEAMNIALRWSGRKVPIVVRLAGQNADYSRKMLADRRIPHELADSITAGARRAVELAKRGR